MELQPIIVAIVAGAASGLVSWGAMRTEIRFLWRDLERVEKRVDVIEARQSLRVVPREG